MLAHRQNICTRLGDFDLPRVIHRETAEYPALVALDLSEEFRVLQPDTSQVASTVPQTLADSARTYECTDGYSLLRT